MHELKQPLYVETPLGKGLAFMVTDYGWHANMLWTVALSNGEVRHFQSTQILIQPDHAWNINYNTKLPWEDKQNSDKQKKN